MALQNIETAIRKLRERDSARVNSVLDRIATDPPLIATAVSPRRLTLLAAAAGLAIAITATLQLLNENSKRPSATLTTIQVEEMDSSGVQPDRPSERDAALASLPGSVGEAVMAAHPGAVVELPEGSFYETIRISKAVTLQAKSGNVQIGLRDGVQQETLRLAY